MNTPEQHDGWICVRDTLAKLLLECLFGELPRIDTELLLQHLRVLLMVDLVGKLLEAF